MNKLKKTTALLLAGFLTGFGSMAMEHATPDWIDMGAELTLETVSCLAGGLERKTGLLGNLDLTFDIDPEKAGGWKNGHVFIYVLGNFGDHPTEYVGDAQGTSNIEAYRTLKLYEAWYEHAFLGETLFLLGGLHDYNSEFDVLEYAGLFLNSSFGISPDMSQTGPSIFPTTSLALRGRAELENGLYLLAAVYDGIPGDPNNPRGTQIHLHQDDGMFSAIEGGLVRSEPATADYFKIGVGGWYQTTDFADFAGINRQNNGGLYAIAETALSEKLGLFLQLGSARRDRNQIASYLGAGINWNGLFCEDDVLGFAAAHARNGDDFMTANPSAIRAETALELTYQLTLSDQWSIQPDLQYIIDPGMDPVVDHALVFALRVVAAY